MTLSDEDVVTEIESWKRFTGALPAWDTALAAEALELGREYSSAIHARDSIFITEPLFMSIMLAQHKEIIALAAEIERLKEMKGARMDP